LRGAPHHAAAVALIDYALSLEGQALWAFKPEVPGGPAHYALRRMPVRRDFYGHAEWLPARSDPEDNPYDAQNHFVYHAAWTGGIFREIGFLTRVMCQDTHAELVRAWNAIASADAAHRSRALAVLQDLGPLGYDRVRTDIHARLTARDRVEEVRLAGELGAYFRARYAEAEAIARGR
jgi:hypothetical protein